MSNNLGLTQLVQSQANKEVTINDQAAEFDAALTDLVIIDLTGATSPLVLIDAQALRAMVLKLFGTHPGGPFTLEVPATKKLYVVWNTSGGAVTVAEPGGLGGARSRAAVSRLSMPMGPMCTPSPAAPEASAVAAAFRCSRAR